jgi:hypothetical protein
MDWHNKALELNKEGKSITYIADTLNQPYKTVQKYLWRYNNKTPKEGQEERKPIIEDKGDYYIITSGKRTITVTKEKYKQFKALYCVSNPLTINQVCYKLDISRRDLMLLKTATATTHDDVPYIDEEFTERPLEELVSETLEKRKEQYFVKLQQEEVNSLRKEVEQYRKKDYVIEKIHDLVSNHFIEFAKVYETPKVILLPKVNSGLMYELPIVDLHFGKLAWQPETGENYDYKIAEKRFMYAIYDAVEQIKDMKLEKILFPIGNDFFNFDNVNGTTTKGTPQTNDLRWQKMYTKGNEVLIRAIDILSQYAPVDVLEVPGNHDEVSMFHAIINIASWFRNNENVTVDTSPKKRKYREFGKCLIGFTHMDKERKRIEGNMQVEVPQAWGRSKYREWHGGHLHSEQARELNGIKIRNLTSVTATDAWHYESGYVGAIAVNQSFIWDKEKGLKNVIYTTVE